MPEFDSKNLTGEKIDGLLKVLEENLSSVTNLSDKVEGFKMQEFTMELGKRLTRFAESYTAAYEAIKACHHEYAYLVKLSESAIPVPSQNPLDPLK